MATPRRSGPVVAAGGQSGQSLPLLLVALALGVLVISALLYAVDARLLTSRVRQQRDRDRYAADAGVEFALNRLRTGDYCPQVGATAVFALPAPVNDVSPTVSVRCVSAAAAGYAWVAQTISTVDLRDVFFLDANNGWVVGGDGTILHTTDGGLTWTAQTASNQFPPAKDIGAVVFKDASCGWAVGEGNKKSVQWTNDGGVTWHLTEKEQTGDLYGLTYDHTSRAWFVGQRGEIWTIDCTGVLANRQSPGITSDLFAVDLVNASTGWVAGAGGLIAKTTDAGAVWTVQSMTRTADLFAVRFQAAMRGWAAGAGGTIWATGDGGASWTLQPVTTTQTLRSIAFSDADTGWIAGDSGTLLQSTDGGASWHMAAVPVTANLDGVFFTDPSHGWIVGSGGLLLRLVAGGTGGVYDITATGGQVTIGARVRASAGSASVVSWQIR